MIVMRLDAESLAHVRFAVSPLTEAMRSVHALDDPGSRAIHLPWVTATRAAVAGLDLAPLRALVPGDVYTPDFTSPPPAGPLVELEDELAAMLAVPPEQVAAEVARTYRRRPMPPGLEPFVTRPARARWPTAAPGSGSPTWIRRSRGRAASCASASAPRRRSTSATAACSSCR